MRSFEMNNDATQHPIVHQQTHHPSLQLPNILRTKTMSDYIDYFSMTNDMNGSIGLY
jgi:hypothetical protein